LIDVALLFIFHSFAKGKFFCGYFRDYFHQHHHDQKVDGLGISHKKTPAPEYSSYIICEMAAKVNARRHKSK
jgi:hypothetical protein